MGVIFESSGPENTVSIFRPEFLINFEFQKRGYDHILSLSFPIDARRHAYKALENYPRCIQENWLEFYYRERRWGGKKGGKTSSRRAAYGATSEDVLLRLLKFQGWKRPPFLSLLDSCASPPGLEDSLRKDTRPSLHFFLLPSFVETLLTKRATIPRSIPPSAPELSLRVSERLPLRKTLAKHPCESFSQAKSATRISENRIFFRNVYRKSFLKKYCT